MTASKIRLYDYVASANCYKVRLLLAQLGRDYERIPIDIFDGHTLTDEYAAINPHRSTPVLELADGRRLVESNAILVHLAAGTEFLPDDPFELAQVVRWLIYEQTDVMPMIGGLRFRLITGRITADKVARRREAAHEVLKILDQHLGEHDFLAAGRYTVADIAVYAYTHVAGDAGIELDPYPAVTAWLERVSSQPGFMDDLEPYPPNAQLGAGRSIYD